MKARIRDTLIELVKGDITRQDTDAIVNAANSSLLGGGGVDGAIHRAAGPQLLEETRTLGGCPTGQAKITRGYNLRARYVIHAVGPIYSRSDSSVADLLASAYRSSLALAAQNGLHSVAFPSISTGVYGYPVELAAPIALNTILKFIRGQNTKPRLVRFVLFDDFTFDVYKKTLAEIIDERGDVQAVE